MTAYYRTTTPRKAQMPHLISTNYCDVCGKPRSCGDNTRKHIKCSRIRQARYAAQGALK